MTIVEWSTCDECGKSARRTISISVYVGGIVQHQEVEVCAECIRVAGIILARAEKDAAKDDVPAPEGERK